MVGVVGSSPIAPTKIGRRIKDLAETLSPFFLVVRKKYEKAGRRLCVAGLCGSCSVLLKRPQAERAWKGRVQWQPTDRWRHSPKGRTPSVAPAACAWRPASRGAGDPQLLCCIWRKAEQFRHSRGPSRSPSLRAPGSGSAKRRTVRHRPAADRRRPCADSPRTVHCARRQ